MLVIHVAIPLEKKQIHAFYYYGIKYSFNNVEYCKLSLGNLIAHTNLLTLKSVILTWSYWKELLDKHANLRHVGVCHV